VRFTLLGDSLDASLSQSEVVTDEKGVAVVTLTAPTTAPSTQFTVRAAIDAQVAASLDVRVTSSGVARIQVEPHYAGQRTVAYWFASVHIGQKCADLSDSLADGDPNAQGLASDQPLIENVPVGSSTAVTVRAGHFATGCADASDLKVNLVNRVAVEVYDLPLKLDSPFTVVLTPSSVVPSWSETLGPVLDFAALETAVLGSAANDPSALLNAMQALAPPRTDGLTKSFSTARSDGSWDEQLRYPPTGTVDKALGDSAIRSQIEVWLRQGLANMPPGSSLTARIDPTGAGGAQLTPLSLAGVSGTEADHGLASATASWSADPGDMLLLGARIEWSPAKLLGSLGANVGRAQTGAADVGGALATAIDCSSVSKLLLAAGAEQGRISFGSCDEPCTVDLCAQALGAIWQAATLALPSTLAVIDISATAKATVDDEARPGSSTGSFKGSIVVGSGAPTNVSGAASFTPLVAAGAS